MKLPSFVKLVEVSPRDGLQNENKLVPTAIKLELIDKLAISGLRVIEATSFVRAPKIPQLADAEEVYSKIIQQNNIEYPVLVPNLIGLERALKLNVKNIAVFTTVSETFCQHNTHCSITESLQRIKEVITEAKKHSIKIRGYISCVLGCPYEGETDMSLTASMTQKLLDLGCFEISLGDTIGVGTPGKTITLLEKVLLKTPVEKIAVHFHDTYGQALANIFAALQLGISVVDASVAGIGGCPYAKGATGNVATEDVLYMLNGLGIDTGVDLTKLIAAGNFISSYLGRGSNSKVAKARG